MRQDRGRESGGNHLALEVASFEIVDEVERDLLMRATDLDDEGNGHVHEGLSAMELQVDAIGSCHDPETEILEGEARAPDPHVPEVADRGV